MLCEDNLCRTELAAKRMRIAAVVLWLTNCLWFVMWAFVWTHAHGQLAAPVALHIKHQAVFEFAAREAVAAGAFFVGAALVRSREVATQ